MKMNRWFLALAVVILAFGCQQQVIEKVEMRVDFRTIVEAVVGVSGQSLANILPDIDAAEQPQMMRDFCQDVRFFADNSGYLMIYDMDGNCIAHGTRPEIQGLNRMDHQDSKGMFNVQEMVKIAQEKGSGWLTYYYQNPSDGKDEQKHSYVMRIPGTDYWMAAGYYEK